MSNNLNHIEYIEYNDKENTKKTNNTYNSNNYGSNPYDNQYDNEYEYDNDLYLSLEKQKKHDERDNISDNIEPESEIQPFICPVIHSEDKKKKYLHDRIFNNNNINTNNINIIEPAGNPEESIENLNYELRDTTNILRDNLDRIIERENKINNIDDKTESLLECSNNFKRKSKDLKYRMIKNYMFHIISIGMIVILIITLIIILTN